jgi:hypothetical protein
VLSVVPDVTITSATSTRRGIVVIRGSGFGGFAAGSATSVTARRTVGFRRNRRTSFEDARVISWSDNRIVAVFGTRPDTITVNSVFGKNEATVGTTGR